MKKIIYWLLGGLISIFLFLTGFLIRQPKINNMKKQLELLQKDNSKLIKMISDNQESYKALLIQHKALKALHFHKKSAIKEQMTGNLIMQYAIKAYLTLLLKSGRDAMTLEKDEIVFFRAFEKVIDGKNPSTGDKVKIRDYIMQQHGFDIKKLRVCEYESILKELENKPIIAS